LFPLKGLKGAVFIERSFSKEEIISFAKVVLPELYSNRPPMKTMNVIVITYNNKICTVDICFESVNRGNLSREAYK
jgi:hypothetical protein